MMKSRKMRWAGYVARIGRRMNIGYWCESQKDGKRPLRRPRGRRVDNIEMDLQEIGWGGVDWLMIGASGGLL
jgi:hypothetical protein